MKPLLSALAVVLLSIAVCAAVPVEPIRTVEVGRNREFRVNGKPFLPLMLWLQSPARIPDGLAIGANTFCGNGGEGSTADYLDALAKNGLYGIFDFEENDLGHSHLLGWIHGDEPDLPRQKNDAEVVPGEGLRLNRSPPLTRIVDGVTHSWSVLDPLKGAQVTVKLAKPETVSGVAVWSTISRGLAVAKEVVLLADGVSELCELAGPKRPVYAWIETNSGRWWSMCIGLVVGSEGVVPRPRALREEGLVAQAEAAMVARQGVWPASGRRPTLPTRAQYASPFASDTRPWPTP